MDTILSALQDLFSSVRKATAFFDKAPSVLGVDIGSSAIKVVQLKKTAGKAVLVTYGELALGPYAGLEIGQATNMPVEKITEGLKDVLRESSVSSKNCAFSIPLSSSLTTMIQMPHVSDKELATMVPLEARKYIPVPINEVTLDWWLIPHRTDRELPTDLAAQKAETVAEADPAAATIDVLIAAIHNETIAKYKALAKNTGLEPTFLEIETFSAMRSVLSSRDTHPIMVLDFGAGSTKLSIVEAGIILKSHVFGRGSQDLTLTLSKSLGMTMLAAEELKREIGLAHPEKKEAFDVMSLILTSIFTEANTMLLSFEKRYNKSIKKVVFIGGGSLLKGILDIAKRNFDTDVEYGDPFSRVGAPAFLGSVLKEAGPEFAVAMGVAFRKLAEVQ